MTMRRPHEERSQQATCSETVSLSSIHMQGTACRCHGGMRPNPWNLLHSVHDRESQCQANIRDAPKLT